jgi:hypothetical protein
VPAALSAHRDSAPFVLIVMVITGCDDSSSVTSSSSSPTSVPTMAAREFLQPELEELETPASELGDGN